MKHLSVFCLTLAVLNLPAQPSRTSYTQRPKRNVLVLGGTFQMGGTEGGYEQPVHSVTVSDFYISKYEVTNAEFVKFLNVKGNQVEGMQTWINLDGWWKDEKCRIYPKRKCL
jgi:formylglycine-generating enzyme required for sulfatase activity